VTYPPKLVIPDYAIDVQENSIFFDVGGETPQEASIRPHSAMFGHVKIEGIPHPVLLPQPQQHGFKWDDKPLMIEAYDIILNDLGRGTSALSQTVRGHR